MRRAPAFWWASRASLAARLLAPAGFVYGAVTAARMTRAGSHSPIPVLCVGNFVAGGSGKTPTVLTVAGLLQSLGHRPAILSRGYGRTEPAAPDAVIHVRPERHRAAEVGDEPLLLARAAPTYVARSRVAAALAAAADGASILLLDDGLQHWRLHKSAAICVVDGATGIGNGLCVPAGPLRAPLDAQWPQVSGLCVIGRGAPGERVAALAMARGVPVWTGRLAPDPIDVEGLRGRRLHAFAGIGHPSKFFSGLLAEGLEVVATHAFPDHHAFSAADLAGLSARAQSADAVLVTTEKDRVRLPAGYPVHVLKVALRLEAEAAVARWLAERFSPSPET